VSDEPEHPLVAKAAELQRVYEEQRREYMKAAIEAGIISPPKEKK
jgi:hypothetical protein